MGFTSNQWLNTGQGLRNRGYHPVSVSVSCRAAHDPWAQRNEVPIEFIARQSSGEYQTLYLTQAEAEAALAALIAALPAQSRETLLVSLLRRLSHAKLLRALALDLNVRVRLPKDR